MPEPVTRGQRYLPGLDGLRAIAVAAVVCYHLGFTWAGGGLLGVGVFFTLSGYLITDILLERMHGKEPWLGQFWLGRARRLLPALLLMLAIVTIWVEVSGKAQSGYGWAALASVFYVSNWQLIFQHLSYFARFGPPSPLGHLWSLGIEEQFYILWPLLLVVGIYFVRERSRASRIRPRLAAVTVVLAAASALEMAAMYHPSFDSSRIYFGTDTRAFELLAGAALAMVWPSRRLGRGVSPGARRLIDVGGVAGLATILVLMYGQNEYSRFLYQGGFVLLSIATAMLVASLVHPAGRLSALMGAAPLVWIGARSYGIYLWHMPIIALTTPASQHSVDLGRAALQVAATISIAALSWHFVEQPIRHGALGRAWRQMRTGTWEPRFPRPGGVTLSHGAVLLAVGAIAVAAASGPGHGTAAKPPTAPRPTTAALITVTRPALVQHATATSTPPKSSCRAVIDIGDSTSEGLTSSSYLPNPKQRIEARFDNIGVRHQHYEIEGARSIVETYDGQANATQVVQYWRSRGYVGCWVLALGTNDTADVAIGSNTSRLARIRQMMDAIGDEPVMWVNVKSLLDTGLYSEQNMQAWDDTLMLACQDYPNMRVYDWASVVKSNWFISDGIHYSTPGYAWRATDIATALATAFPAKGKSSGCLVR
jgi:peptidoglycan/LPS O-acetylase OafA/YrhL